MAVVVRPPFWIPRPWDEAPWVGAPQESVLHLLFTSVIKPPQWQTPPDDSSFWQGSPTNSYIGYSGIAFTQFRSPGQVLQKNWANQIVQQDDPPVWQGAPEVAKTVYFSTRPLIRESFVATLIQDDPPMWQGAPRGTETVWSLINQKFFGQGGQVPQFRANLTYHHTSDWIGQPYEVNIQLHAPGAAQAPTMSPFYVPRPADNQQEWQGKPIAGHGLATFNQQKMFGTPGQVPTYKQNFTYDDPAEWVGKSVATNVPLSGVQGPRPLSIYNASENTYDDPSFWPAASIASPRLLLASGGPTSVPTMAPMYAISGGDHSSVWLSSPVAPPELLRQVIFGMGSAILWAPDDPNDIDPLWPSLFAPNQNVLSIKPSPSITTLRTTAPSLLMYNDVAAEWVGRPLTDRPMYDLMNPKMFGQPGQAPTKKWLPLYVQDDSAVWYMRTLKQNYETFNIPIIYPPGTTVAGFFNLRWGPAAFNFDVGDAAFWAGAPFSPNYPLTQPGPPVPPPVITAIFTVSGENVEQNFQEFFSGVSYTDAPIPKRTA